MQGMVTEAFVNRRKGRCMAQVLEEFEQKVEPHLPAEVATEFKALFRRKLHVFASDVIEQLEATAEGMIQNGSAVALRDRLHPDRT